MAADAKKRMGSTQLGRVHCKAKGENELKLYCSQPSLVSWHKMMTLPKQIMLSLR